MSTSEIFNFEYKLKKKRVNKDINTLYANDDSIDNYLKYVTFNINGTLLNNRNEIL